MIKFGVEDTASDGDARKAEGDNNNTTSVIVLVF